MRVEHCAPALRWLEKQACPEIVAPKGVSAGHSYRLYVPDNVGDVVGAAWARGRDADIADYRTEKDVRPTHIDGEAIHYLFPLANGDREFESHRETLITAARSITHLGWGIDMVVGNAALISEAEASKLPGERWQRTETQRASGFRVPCEGTLDELIRKFDAFQHRLVRDACGDPSFNPVSPLSVFRPVVYRRATDPPTRRYAAFRLRHPIEDRSAVFAATRSNSVAAMFRNLAARVAHEQGRPNDWIDRYVHGHREKDDHTLPRFSYLPLPSIERRGERGPFVGAIRRAIVAELVDSSESYLPWVRQMLPGQFLLDDKTDESPEDRRRAMLTPLTGGDWVLRQYTDYADTWATVTPLVLPGSDEGKFAKAEKLFFKALRHAGYSPDALAELEFRNVSFWPGGDLALRFHRPDYLKKDCWSVYHVRLRWKHPINGPLALGAGRHCGLGIFAASRES
jgi:CRISPR-associated protein Csb2